MATIARLLIELARDPELRERFLRAEDREAVMREYELTEGQQAIVLSGDLERIRQAIDYEAATEATELLPDFGEEGEVEMLVTWRPIWVPPIWIKRPPESK